MPIGNTLLIDGLRSQVPKYAPRISPDDVIRVGPLNLQALTNIPDVLHGLQVAYTIAISYVNYFLVAVICISVPTACGMEWLNIKNVSARRAGNKNIQVASTALVSEQVIPQVQEKHGGETLDQSNPGLQHNLEVGHKTG